MRAVEVIAVMGDAVVDVKHVAARQRSVTTTLLVATSAIALLVAAAMFLWSVDLAASNAAGRRYHLDVLGGPAYSYRPVSPNLAADIAMFAGLGVGLVAAMAAVLRSRRDRTNSYRVGTAPDVDLPLATASRTEFPLIACVGDQHVVTYDERFGGELTVGGSSVSLADLALSERARPSSFVAGAIEIPIPSGARIRVRSGAVTIFASSIDAPAPAPLRRSAVDYRALVYFVGSLALHLAVVRLVPAVPADESAAWSLRDADQIETGIQIGPNIEAPPEEEVAERPVLDQCFGPHGPGEAYYRRLERQEAIQRKSVPIGPNAGHELSRDDVVEAARIAGMFSLGGGTGWSTICGEPVGCRYGTLGHGRGTGEGYGAARGISSFRRGHHAIAPELTIGRPVRTGGLDKEILRRYFRRNIAALTACYEKELLAHPTLPGGVLARFIIAGDGTVQSVQVTNLGETTELAEAATCVSSVVKTIKFPASAGGGVTQVSYPLLFRVTGS